MHHSGAVTWLTALPIGVAGLLAGALVTAVALRGRSGRLRRNWWAGIRTPATMSSDQAFATANRAGAPLMLAGGVIAMIGGLLAIVMGILVNGLVGLFVGFALILIMGVLTVIGGIAGVRAARRMSR